MRNDISKAKGTIISPMSDSDEGREEQRVLLPAFYTGIILERLPALQQTLCWFWAVVCIISSIAFVFLVIVYLSSK